MSSKPQTKTEAVDAITALRSSLHSGTEAVSKLERYIHHLEELLLEHLGRQEFEQRLESLLLRDQRNEESLFVSDDNSNSVSRKRGSSSKETGSSPKKKSRSNSQISSLGITSGLGRSIFDKGRLSHDDSPDVSPRTSRKPSVSEQPIVDYQQATTETKLAQRTIITPRPGPRRTSQPALLPNKHPSYHKGSSSLVAIRTSESAAPSQPTQPSAPSTRDPVQSEKATKQSRSGSVSSICGASSLREPTSATSATSASKTTMTPTLSKKPVTPSAQVSASSTKKPSTPSTKTSYPSYSQALSSPVPSSKPSSLPNKPGSGSGRTVFSLNQQPLSSTKKPSRASKKA